MFSAIVPNITIALLRFYIYTIILWASENNNAVRKAENECFHMSLLTFHRQTFFQTQYVWLDSLQAPATFMTSLYETSALYSLLIVPPFSIVLWVLKGGGMDISSYNKAFNVVSKCNVRLCFILHKMRFILVDGILSIMFLLVSVGMNNQSGTQSLRIM